MDAFHRPCPVCGGVDRFYLIANPRNGGAPYWRCRQCDHTDPAGTLPGFDADRHDPPPTIDPGTREAIYRCYDIVAQMCVERLWSSDGRRALAYLRQRGLTPETLRTLRIGWSGAGDDLLTDLWRREIGRLPVDRCTYSTSSSYDVALLGGLRFPGGAHPRGVLRGCVTLPYYANGRCVWLRGRKLAPRPGEPRYFAPAGPAFAGGAPRFYLHDLLHDHAELLLTEGELKCLLAHQEWRAGRSLHPCIAVPGAAFLPPDLAAALRGATVHLAFDTDASGAGQRLALRAAEKLRLAGAAVRIITLPLPAGKAKADLDSFILEETTHATH